MMTMWGRDTSCKDVSQKNAKPQVPRMRQFFKSLARLMIYQS